MRVVGHACRGYEFSGDQEHAWPVVVADSEASGDPAVKFDKAVDRFGNRWRRGRLPASHHSLAVAEADTFVMTIVPNEPTALTDEALRLIGAIAVESARLEWQFAGLRSIVDPTITHIDALGVPHDRQVKEILGHLQARENDIIGVPDEIIDWAKGALRLLKRRGDLMHSSWVLGEAGAVESHHLRSGRKEPVDPAPLAEFVDELREYVRTGVALWLSAATWEQVENSQLGQAGYA
jgi:hypothetical protein